MSDEPESVTDTSGPDVRIVSVARVPGGFALVFPPQPLSDYMLTDEDRAKLRAIGISV